MMIYQDCPMCHYEHSIELDDAAYKRFKFGEGLIQDLLPELDDFEREFMKTGYCPKCQELLFGRKYTGTLIKEAE